MKLMLAVAASTLLLVACDAGVPADDPTVAQATDASKVDDSAQPSAKESSPIPSDETEVAMEENWFQSEPGMVLVQPAMRDRVRIVIPWEASNHEDRRKRLEDLAARGSEWAKDTLRKLDEGEIHPSELDDSADTVTDESLKHPPKLTALRGGNDNGCAPMPFGGSMFGPWDTGRGPVDP
jgi:hypothetical protein